jgi:S1-C subfamily serine protease
VAEGLLLNNEEVPLWPVYRDPVHDFGFYRFDPGLIDHMLVEELALEPDRARVGVEIRVVGNDAGEKLSILDGTLARLDRNAPSYGDDTYNDFNTFYIQAASNTSGGSSGSPVVDIAGRVVALNAGGSTRAASSFYLPLDRVVRALPFVRDGVSVPRGTAQVVFLHETYDEAERLGLRPATQAALRVAFPEARGLLAVSEVVPGGPAARAGLQPGDLLVRIDGHLVADFVGLEAPMDDAVGRTLRFEVERAGVPVTLDVPIEDLHAITPDRFVEVGRGVLHELSFMAARNHARPVGGVFLAQPGYVFGNAGIPDGAVISAIDGVAVPNLQTAWRVLGQAADGQRLRVRYNRVSDPRHEDERVVVMDRRWYAMRQCARSDEVGVWRCGDAPDPPPSVPLSVPDPIERPVDGRVARRLAGAFAMVEVDLPYLTAGIKDANYTGAGVVVDAERGWLLVDRDTLPVALGDISVTFGGVLRVPASLVYLHPVHNWAVVAVDPASLGDTRLTEPAWRSGRLEEGEDVWQVGLDADHALVENRTSVDRVAPLLFGVSRTPRFRDVNVEGIWLDDAERLTGGLIADRKGRGRGVWASFYDPASEERTFYGLPASFVVPVLDALRRGEAPIIHTLGADLATTSLVDAADLGVSSERIAAQIEHDGRKDVDFLSVTRTHGGTPAFTALRDADILLSVDGEPVSRMDEIDALWRQERALVTVLRDGREVPVDLALHPLDGAGTDRMVSFAGMVLHASHPEVSAQQKLDPAGVYVAWSWYGTPAARYGMRPTRRVLRVDDVATPTLDAFVAAIQDRKDRSDVRLTYEKLDGSKDVVSLKLDLRYWPSFELRRVDGQWVRTVIP